MNTVIFEHVDNSTAELLKQLAEKMGLHFKSKKEKQESGIVTNPELINRIKRIENGTAEYIDIDIQNLKKVLNA